ncbi:hypothetical protein Tco_1559278 [Tanacetum coccineum]
MTPCVGMNKASTSGYSKESPSNKGIFSLSNTFEDLIVDNPIVKEVATGNKANTSGKQLEMVDYLDNLGSDDEVKPDNNETASFLAYKPMGL